MHDGRDAGMIEAASTSASLGNLANRIGSAVTADGGTLTATWRFNLVSSAL
jgi:hypothetical protein